MSTLTRDTFWKEAFALHGSITPKVSPLVVTFGLIALAICVLNQLGEWFFEVRLALQAAPYEFAGAVLGLLLVMRTNTGYERWWEARKLWGGIVNQSRNLVISALAYGPTDPRWREDLVRWTAVFPHVARLSLLGQRPISEVVHLVGPEGTKHLAGADHMPGYVALRLAQLLQEASGTHGLDRFSFLQIDRERASLIDHIGGCERILKTPLPRAYSIRIRRFLFLFLVTMPFALLHKFEGVWLVPVVSMLVAYPLLALDQLGIELENPFSLQNLSPLPLEEISATIEANLFALLKGGHPGTTAPEPVRAE